MKLKKKIDKRIDIIGRNDKFKKINIDKTFPKYILENINEFKDWIC